MTQNKPNMSRRALLCVGAAALTASPLAAQPTSITTDIDPDQLRGSQTTPLSLYLSPRAAHDALQADPDILFIDVRDPIEITYVGHPQGLTKIIPLNLATHQVNPETGQYRVERNEALLRDFDALLAAKNKTKSDPIFVTCRSGSRSATAARVLIDAGYTNVWNLTEGFEGGKSDTGVRAVNGWRNAGLPWGYALGAGVAWEARR